MTFLAIDPGRDTGWAIMREDAQLVACGLGAPPLDFGFGHRVIIERPQVYGRGGKGDPNDLITLAIQVGRYTERFVARGCAVEEILPHTWKGSLDADVCCRRVWAALSDVEKIIASEVLAPLARKPLTSATLTEGKRHNVLDAIGLARWSTLRARAGVFSPSPALDG